MFFRGQDEALKSVQHAMHDDIASLQEGRLAPGERYGLTTKRVVGSTSVLCFCR
jgi:hypothetical protein